MRVAASHLKENELKILIEIRIRDNSLVQVFYKTPFGAKLCWTKILKSLRLYSTTRSKDKQIRIRYKPCHLVKMYNSIQKLGPLELGGVVASSPLRLLQLG